MFLIFLTNVYLTCKNKGKSVSLPSTKISFTIEIPFAIIDQSRAILSFVFAGEAGMGEGVALFFASPPPPPTTQMTDGTQKPKIPSKFAKHAARYNKLAVKHGI